MQLIATGLLALAALCAGLDLAPVLVCPADATSHATVGVLFVSTFAPTGRRYIYAVASGSLPPGLLFTRGGAVTGIPTAAGSFTFCVRATDTLLRLSSGVCCTYTVCPDCDDGDPRTVDTCSSGTCLHTAGTAATAAGRGDTSSVGAGSWDFINATSPPGPPPNTTTAWAIAGATIGGCLTLAIIIFAAMRYSGDARAAHLAKLPPVEALETALAAYDDDEDADTDVVVAGMDH